MTEQSSRWWRRIVLVALAVVAVACLWNWARGRPVAGPVIAGPGYHYSVSGSMFEPRQWLLFGSVAALGFAALAWRWRRTVARLTS